jgi:hypothetical protein
MSPFLQIGEKSKPENKMPGHNKSTNIKVLRSQVKHLTNIRHKELFPFQQKDEIGKHDPDLYFKGTPKFSQNNQNLESNRSNITETCLT